MVTPGFIEAMMAFRASSTQRYIFSCSALNRPDTGQVRVMSDV
jgi:hypothetical protein